MIVSWSLIFCVSAARAEDVNVAENIKNSFQPERFVEVLIHDDPRHPESTKKISWDEDDTKVVIRNFGKSAESRLLLKGRIKKENAEKWRVLWNSITFDVNSKGDFSAELPFDTGFKTLDLIVVGPRGEVEYHFYQVALKALESPDLKFNQKLDKRLFFSTGVGFSQLHYTQADADVPDYRSTVVTVKASANYFLAPPTWDIGFTGFFNIASITKSDPVDVRFIGLNLRLGYLFPQVQAPWRLSVYGGWYYSTMIASNDAFGFKNISGPQLFPVLRRTLNNGHAISSYVKFSPVSSSLGFLSLSNNETAFGLSYMIPTEAHNYSISFDYARLYLNLDETIITYRSLSLGASMSF